VACTAFVTSSLFTELAVAIRNSKDRSGPVLAFSPAEWEAFTAGVRDGQFDLP
jgi:hypothetical protein